MLNVHRRMKPPSKAWKISPVVAGAELGYVRAQGLHSVAGDRDVVV